jgi:Ni,Fe-hydrogenase III large subunit
MTEPLHLEPYRIRAKHLEHAHQAAEARWIRELIAEVERLREAVLAVDEQGFVASYLLPADQVEKYRDNQMSDYWQQVRERIVYPAFDAARKKS